VSDYQCNTSDSSGDIDGCVAIVVDPPNELGKQPDAEEIVRISEEAHTRNDDGCHVVPLRMNANIT
jgi:hypothetical protein